MDEPLEEAPNDFAVRIPIPFEHPIAMIRAIKQISHLDLPEAMRTYKRLVERSFTDQPWGLLALHASETREDAIASLKVLGIDVRLAGHDGAT